MDAGIASNRSGNLHEELTDAAVAASAHGGPRLANVELISWRETAATLADRLGGSPVEWLDETAPVERP